MSEHINCLPPYDFERPMTKKVYFKHGKYIKYIHNQPSFVLADSVRGVYVLSDLFQICWYPGAEKWVLSKWLGEPMTVNDGIQGFHLTYDMDHSRDRQDYLNWRREVNAILSHDHFERGPLSVALLEIEEKVSFRRGGQSPLDSVFQQALQEVVPDHFCPYCLSEGTVSWELSNLLSLLPHEVCAYCGRVNPKTDVNTVKLIEKKLKNIPKTTDGTVR